MTDPTPEQVRAVAEVLCGDGFDDRRAYCATHLYGGVAQIGACCREGRETAERILAAVRAALTSDDPAVVRAMAERVGLTISTRERYEAACRDSLDPNGQPTVFSFGQDRPWRILEAIRRRELGLSPETHICMGAIQTFASVSTWSPWREVPQ